MKSFSLTRNLSLITLGAGLLGALLRLLLYVTAQDEKGLLVRGHFFSILLMILTAAVAVILFLGCRPLKGGTKYSFNFPSSLISAVGCFCGAAGLLIDAFSHMGGGLLEAVTFLLGIAGAAALGFVGVCRYKGRNPSVLFHGIVCLYLALELVSIYQTWSSAPQLQDYAFSLLGCICAMLACYHDAAFTIHSGNRKQQAFFHLAAVYLCLVSLPENGSALFYLTLAIWMFTGLCQMAPYQRRREPRAEA